MPYQGQFASKHGHSDILKNPDVKRFLNQCPDVPKPSAEDLIEVLDNTPTIDEFQGELPKYILAIDGSSYETPVDGRFPSRRVGYIKISSVLLDMERYEKVKNTEERYIDPMAVARLQRETGTISLALPGAYVKLNNCLNVKESYRQEILTYFQGETTRLKDRTLYDTLIYLISYLNRIKTINNKKFVVLKICPDKSCEKPWDKEILIDVLTGVGECPLCGQKVYATDALRTHEAFIENGSNIEAYNRLMSALEHLLAVHYLCYLWKENPNQLSGLCILIDGPLAIFGQAAPFYRAIMRLIDTIRTDLNSRGLQEPLIIGITKTGRICEHFEQIDHLVSKKTIFPISDTYRYQYVEPSKAGSTRNFGDDTYYGQDFYVKTERGRRFSLCLAYPFPEKIKNSFQHEKTELKNYTQIGRALNVLQTLESDLYENAMIPVVLAHRHASISLRPGGKVLDILSRNSF